MCTRVLRERRYAQHVLLDTDVDRLRDYLLVLGRRGNEVARRRLRSGIHTKDTLLATCATGLDGLRHRSYNVGFLFPGILLTVRTIRANRGGYFRTVSCVSLEPSSENILSSTVIEAIAHGTARASVYVCRGRKAPRVPLPTSIGSTKMNVITVTENVRFEISRQTFFMNYDLKMFVDRYQALRKDLLRETTYVLIA